MDDARLSGLHAGGSRSRHAVHYGTLFIGVKRHEKPSPSLMEEHNRVQAALDAACRRRAGAPSCEHHHTPDVCVVVTAPCDGAHVSKHARRHASRGAITSERSVRAPPREQTLFARERQEASCLLSD